MGLEIQGNLLALNASNNLNIARKDRAKSAERLSSGYKINRAADDAAGLSISEKMRRQIRGLNQGSRNARDGVSFVQIGDGTLNEVDDMIHRMTELSVKAGNGTLSVSDRADIQAEFRQIQMEIDQITENSIFNETHVFSEHEPTFHSIDGNKVWDQGHTHVIDDDNDTMSFTIQKDPGSPEQTLTITVKPHGNYTTAELNSAIDDALISSGASDAGIEVVYKMDGTFDVTYEGGQNLKSVEGGLSYLLYDLYNGASTGALIGSTIFTSDDARLRIVSGQNDNLSFDIIDFYGGANTKSITLPAGYYTRQEIMDMLNDKLSDTSVTAVAKGTGIKLETSDAIITRFKGNMFKIEESNPKYTSVFYDNVKYGGVYPKNATFTGGYVLDVTGNASQQAYSKYNISSENNTLSVKPDGGDVTYTVTIPNGEYSAAEMSQKLNDLFSAKGAPVTVSPIQNGYYSGLVLTSKTKGTSSDVGVISSSSAYNTLFVDRRYYNPGASQYSRSETTADKNALYTGANTITSSDPLVIKENENDSFKLNDGSNSYTIKLSAKTYTSADMLAAEINTHIAENAGINGRVSAVVVNNRIQLKSPATSSNMITNLTASEVSGNKGYKDIFYDVYYTNTTTSSTGRGTVTTAETVSDPVTISGTDTTFKVIVAGTSRTVNFTPAGSYSHDQIVEKINNALQGSSGEINNTFSSVTRTGTSSTTNVTSATVAGRTDTVSKVYNSTGTYENSQGSTASDVNIPAKVILDQATVPSNISIGNNNNEMYIVLDGVGKNITLSNKIYSQSELVSEIQSKIDEACAGSGIGATVSISGGHLCFESKIASNKTGDQTSISVSTTASPFFKELHTTYSPATATSSTPLLSSINITNETKDFSFTVDGHLYKVEIPVNTYSRDTLINKLNELMRSAQAEASIDTNGKLVLSTIQKGAGHTISYSSNVGDNSSADSLFGPRTAETAASAVANCALQSSISIASPGTKLRLNVDGSNKAVDLKTGTYSNRQQFVNMVNQCFREQGVGATAFLSGNNIGYTSNTKGTGSKISISYDSSTDSAMKAMYGSQVSNIPAVTASFNGSGQLVLSSPGNNLTVQSTNGSVFQRPERTERATAPTAVTGFKSTVTSYTEGTASISFPVTVSRYNNRLIGTYGKGTGVSERSMDIRIAAGTYNDIASLVDAVKSSINNASIPLDVTVSSNGSNIRFSAQDTGSNYNVKLTENNNNTFYNIVIRNAVTKTEAQSVKDTKGSAPLDTAYVVGRKDIRNRTTVIEKDTNDELTLDLTINGSTTTLSMKLDEGSYNGTSLVSMIQEKLNNALTDKGFETGFIKAALGEKNTGVEGANDSNALDFILNPNASFGSAKEPEGEYVIDGVGGSAAFHVFYQTDGEMVKAYAMGAKNLSGGVSFTGGNNELSFTVDNVPYDLTIPPGNYSAEEIRKTLQDLSDNAGAPVNIRLQDGKLKIEHKSQGKHMITGISGSARQELFFNEVKDKRDNNDIPLQMSGESSDIEEITRHRVDTAAIKINGCCLTTIENARKTIGRLSEALHRVSDVRSYLGAKQNRLEHAIKVNDNTSENTEAGESRIRDTDMALEVLRHSKASILEQVSAAMLTQANQNPERVLSLLQ